ncbi:Pentalenene oxygenase [Pirellulimonas nuda]|uniref:Pentalenene oxygenase n=1 Tax=Pirellulimonas nuda TaxID=2528009 RepID=A0A518DA47_9BACT|nr:cytochrome P450 [Pirellulimonas nuda]QDU88296.1 Pentalenene oxygenase [Pirellulimonas nuda]
MHQRSPEPHNLAMEATAQPPTESQGGLPVTEGSFADLSKDMFVGIRELHRRHGPIAALDDAGLRIIFLFDPQYNRQVLSDANTFHARFFGIRGPKRSSQRRLTCGLLAMNGEQHRRNRRMLKEPFGLKTIATYRPAIAALARQAADELAPGRSVDMNEEMTRYMLRVTSSILFGLDEPKMAYELGEMIANWVSQLHDIGVGALAPDAGFTAGYEHLLGYAQELEGRVMEMISRRRKDPGQANDVLSILVRMHDEQGGLSDEELVGQSCVLFGAAHMTTAHSLTWTLFLLAQHPSVLRELLGQLPPDEQAGDEVREVDPSALLERVVRESMRVLPASAYSQRITSEFVRVGPFDLAPGTPIVFTPLVTHHLASTFPEPERFLPDRWLQAKPSAYEYHPFGAGPRMCIGGPMAMEVIRTSLPILLRRFGMRVPAGSDVSAEVRSTMLNPQYGMPMELLEPGAAQANPVRGNVNELVDLVEAVDR